MNIVTIAVAFGVGVLVGRLSTRTPSKLKASFNIPSKEHEAAIINLFKTRDQIQNSDVRKILNVSDATAVRYLDALEQKNLITQQGATGRSTFYTKN